MRFSAFNCKFKFKFSNSSSNRPMFRHPPYDNISIHANKNLKIFLSLSSPAVYIKVKGCHVNRCNASSQVGIVAINLLGRSGGFEDSLVKLPTNDMHENFNKDKKLVSSNVKTINHKLCQKVWKE